MILKVRRFDPSTQQVRYDHYEVRQKPGKSVLDALIGIQERIDESLAFRYSCRQAGCGACAMLINRVPRLACRTQLSMLLEDCTGLPEPLSPATPQPFTEPWSAGKEIIIEPLPNFQVLKDLIVDYHKLFGLHATVSRFRARIDCSAALPLGALPELAVYSSCTYCGLCYASCPAAAKNLNFRGPSALAQLYCAAASIRAPELSLELLRKADDEYGWRVCELCGNCRRVCPQGIPANEAIRQAQERLQPVVSEPVTGETPFEALPLQSPVSSRSVSKPRRGPQEHLRDRLRVFHRQHRNRLIGRRADQHNRVLRQFARGHSVRFGTTKSIACSGVRRRGS